MVKKTYLNYYNYYFVFKNIINFEEKNNNENQIIFFFDNFVFI